MSEPTSGACDISGDTIVAGAYANSTAGFQSGAVYLFERVGGVWTETDSLLAPTPRAEDRFGYSVALQGGTLVVGTPRSLANEPGHAFVFERVGGAWSLVAELSVPSAVASDEFGVNVALSALRHSENRGAIFVFRHGPAGWSEEAKMNQAGSQPGDFLGPSVALSGDRLLAGTINDTEGRAVSGAGHLFERSGATWTPIGRYVPSDPSVSSFFGEHVAHGPPDRPPAWRHGLLPVHVPGYGWFTADGPLVSNSVLLVISPSGSRAALSRGHRLWCPRSS